MIKHLRMLLLLLGILVMAASLLVELLPGANPGFSYGQMALLVVGGLLALLSRLRASPLMQVGAGLVGIGVTLLVLELLLAGVGYAPVRGGTPFVIPPEFTCDAAGCRWQGGTPAALDCANARMSDTLRRLCAVNAQGFYDAQDFQQMPAAEGRVLVLGDSFTWGSTADIGISWVEITEAALPDVTLWNTGMPYTSTVQQLASAQYFTPIMQPDLVLLAFFADNDFHGNLKPFTTPVPVLVLREPYNLGFIDRYSFEVPDDPRRLSDAELYEVIWGFDASAPLVNFFSRFRVSSVLLRGLQNQTVQQETLNLDWRAGVEPTRRYLRELREVVAAHEAQLVVLLVPGEKDVGQASAEYQAARDLLDDLGVPYLDMQGDFVASDYENPEPSDKHWNNTGHARAAAQVTDWLYDLLANRTP